MKTFKKLSKRSVQGFKRRSRQWIALFVGVIFLTDTLFASSGMALNAIAPQIDTPVTKSSFFDTLRIPAEAGQLETLAMPKNKKKNTTYVLFIQDAHANPEAQKNIAVILNALAENNQLAGVAVEGAFGPVDVRLLDVFDEDKTNREFQEELVNQGQLTGAEIFSRNAQGFQIPVQGVDDRELYLQSFKVYQEIHEDKISQEVLESYQRIALRAEMTFLSSDLAAFLRERRAWFHKGTQAADYVRLFSRFAKEILGIDLANPENQFEWPSLMRLVRSIELEDALNAEGVQADILRLKKDWAGKANAALFDHASEALIESLRTRAFGTWLKRQAGISQSSTRQFFEALLSASAKDGISLLNYPDLLSFAALLILHEELVTKTLMEELQPLEVRIEEKLTRSLDERKVVQFSKDLELIEKLIHLKLTRADYEVLNERRHEFTAEALHERLLRVSAGGGFPVPETDFFIQTTLDGAFNFYQQSMRRDSVLVTKSLALAPEKSKSSDSRQVIALIAGGFHQEGILQALEDQGIAHAVVTPVIKSMPSEPLYEKVMSGRSSMLTEALSISAATLMAEILGAPDYLDQAAAPWRRESVLLEGLFRWKARRMVKDGQSAQAIYQVLSRGLRRAHTNGLIEKSTLILKDTNQPDELAELHLKLMGQGLEFHYAITPAGIRQTLARQVGTLAGTSAVAQKPPVSPSITASLDLSRSEVRSSSQDEPALDKDAHEWLNNLPRNQAYRRTLAMMKALEGRKKQQTLPLTHVYAQSLSGMGPARSIPVIEVLVDEIASEFNLKSLPIAYRAAFVLQAFDAEHFSDVHERLLSALRSVNISTADDRLSIADYRKLTQIGEAEHLTGVDQFILMHTALNRYLIDLPRKERRALEKEGVVVELMKELDSPGTGNLKQIVFLTDLHGGTKTGDLIGYSLGLKNYRRIRSLKDLIQRLRVEGIDIDKKNILFVGGSDYVDRGPNPYRAFEFVRWLRDKGKLKFINGNHDLWKDWNLLGVHLRVQDALMTIAQSGKVEDSAIEQYAGRLALNDEHLSRRDGTFASFISTIGKSDEQIQQIQHGLEAMVRRFLKAIREKSPEETLEAISRQYANEVIDFGANDNHSLEWWARDWYEHAGWADMFLDEMNEILINSITEKVNGIVADSAGILLPKLKAALSADLTELPEVLRADRDLFLANLEDGRLFNNIEAALFSAYADVKEEKAKIEELKAKNAQIRKENESLAAQGRFLEQKPQFSVPTTFHLTAKHAQEQLSKIKAQIDALNQLVPSDFFPNPDLTLVTPENYRSNNVVVDTALWNLKHLRLVYVDTYGNAYLHGIIPIEENSLDFNVQYKGLPGVAAIERMQYDIRRFFEKYDTIPDTAEFRALMDQEVGEAFRILNNWYSDKTAYLKPSAFKKFLAKGGPASYSYTATSPLHARVYNPSAGLMHVGHIDLTKMRDAKAPYWIFGLISGIINGDHDLSEAYTGLGAVISHFMRDADGRLTGLRRFGYQETVASLSKDLKDAEKEKKKAEKSLAALGEITADNESEVSKYQQEIGELAAEIDDLKKRLAVQKGKVDQDGGETIEDITLHELPESEQANAKPFFEGSDYAYYYAQRFLEELSEDYGNLEQGASDRGLGDRARYYQSRLKDVQEQLTFLRQRHGKDHPLHPARSEVRLTKTLPLASGDTDQSLERYLAGQNRRVEAVFATAIVAASSTVDLDLADRFPIRVKERLFGLASVYQDAAEAVVSTDKIRVRVGLLMKAQQNAERPKTVVLVSVHGQVPQIDPSLMDLLPGSRVVVLDRRGSEAVGRRQFSKFKLPPYLQPEHFWYQGEYPTIEELKKIFEKGSSSSRASDAEPGQAALPLLVFPYVDEHFLNQYAVLKAEDGIVVRTPKMRGVKLRKSFSRFLGLRAAPSELRDILPDEFKVQVREYGFSSAFIPLSAEGRFASLISAVMQTRSVESAA